MRQCNDRSTMSAINYIKCLFTEKLFSCFKCCDFARQIRRCVNDTQKPTNGDENCLPWINSEPPIKSVQNIPRQISWYSCFNLTLGIKPPGANDFNAADRFKSLSRIWVRDITDETNSKQTDTQSFCYRVFDMKNSVANTGEMSVRLLLYVEKKKIKGNSTTKMSFCDALMLLLKCHSYYMTLS